MEYYGPILFSKIVTNERINQVINPGDINDNHMTLTSKCKI